MKFRLRGGDVAAAHQMPRHGALGINALPLQLQRQHRTFLLRLTHHPRQQVGGGEAISGLVCAFAMVPKAIERLFSSLTLSTRASACVNSSAPCWVRPTLANHEPAR